MTYWATRIGQAIVDPRDTDALVRAILTALNDPIAAAGQAAAIRDTAAARVDWSTVAEGYGNILASCLPRKASAP